MNVSTLAKLLADKIVGVLGPPKGEDITTDPTPGNVTVVNFEKPIYEILIRNKSTTDTLYVSFDGKSWIDIPAEAELFVDNLVEETLSLWIKSDGASQPVSLIYRHIVE